MTTIGLAVQKGGVGKTTLAVHLAYYAAQQKRRVILLDADPQGNASSWLLSSIENSDVYNLLMTQGNPQIAASRAIRAVPAFGIGLVASNNTTSDALVMLGAVGRLSDVTERVTALASLCDLCIVDMPPSRNTGFLDLLRACDWIVIPTELERHSIEGVTLMARVAQQLCDEGRGPRLMGIVPNDTNVHTVLHRAQMSELMQAYGQAVWPALPHTVKVGEVCAGGSTLFAEYPNEEITRKMRAVARRMMEVLKGTQKTARTTAVRRAAC